MAGRITHPEIGTKMYNVWENLYYIKGKASPRMEYIIVEGTVSGFYEGGYAEVCLHTDQIPNKGTVPYRARLSDIGKKIFYTPREAAELAQIMTEKYERVWHFMSDVPLPRSWEKYLKETEKCRPY